MNELLQEIMVWTEENCFNLEAQDGTVYSVIDYDEMKTKFPGWLQKEKQQSYWGKNRVARVQDICNFFGVNYTALLSKSREQSCVFTRAIISTFLISEGLTYCEIGELINRDRATISHYQKNVMDKKLFAMLKQYIDAKCNPL
jgi:chromosomal replication initiation ATPase DnaA